MQTSVSSFGRLSSEYHTVVSAGAGATAGLTNALPRGLGSSYGDVCLNPGGTLLQTSGLNNLLAFDAESGLLTVEAGVTLGEIQRVFAPKGWMLSVTPGTQFVTVGGAIGNDVHGKNHHARGTFGDNTVSFSLVRSSGEVLHCSRTENSDLFHATIGGLGLTGLITSATIQLQPVWGAYLDTETLVFQNSGEFLSLSDASEPDWQYIVSWIDCTSKHGRGIFMRGNNSADTRVPEVQLGGPKVPFTPPISLINRASVLAFNQAYFNLNRLKAGAAKTHYQPYFYPLDSVRNWNLAYGPRGFYQYQMVIPRTDGREVLDEVLGQIRKSGQGSFLAVLKTFGDQNGPGMLSFARPGITLALDFTNYGERSEKLFERLDEVVLAAGGTLNPSKDARMSRQMFEQGFPGYREFEKFRDSGISSAMSRRLMGW
ncbi:MAG: FAD-binding oxidoreductase [Micrococcales bacterium]